MMPENDFRQLYQHILRSQEVLDNSTANNNAYTFS